MKCMSLLAEMCTANAMQIGTEESSVVSYLASVRKADVSWLDVCLAIQLVDKLFIW